MALAPFVTRTTNGTPGGPLGRPQERADARIKVRGEVPYAAEHHPDGVLYGFPVLTTVPAGQITAIRTEAAERVPGVVAVITHENSPLQGPLPPAKINFFVKLLGPKPVLRRDDVLFHGQYVALVVAESFETARDAAALVEVDVEAADAVLDFDTALADAYKPKAINGAHKPDTQEGDVDAAMRDTAAHDGAVTIDATYDTPYEHAVPIELHGAVAEQEGDTLVVHDAQQAVSVTAISLATTILSLPAHVRVESRYVGGGFGSKFGLRPHATLAAIATKVTGRPVKGVLTRRDSFTDYGQRTRTRQRVRLAAEADGRLTAVAQECWSQTSMDDEFVEQTGTMARLMYAAPNRMTRHRVAPMHTPTPAYMRAPGEAPGSFGLECAMDELAHTLHMDPIALRRRNEPAEDPDTGLPWSSRSLQECLAQGAARFGWERRDPTPGQVRDGQWLVGMGVAGATYPYLLLPTAARVSLLPDGVGGVAAHVEIAASDIGTGAFTILLQIAAAALGLEVEQVRVDLGDSTLPKTFGASGSTGTASWGAAVVGASEKVRKRLAGLAHRDKRSPLYECDADRIVLAGGRIALDGPEGQGEPLGDLLARRAKNGVSAHFNSLPPSKPKFATHAFGAQFAEVGVDADTGEVRVRRLLGAFGVGRVLNPRTSESQLIGGMTMGIGQALMEETVLDPRWGQWVNRDLAEYHVPVHADVPAIEAFTVEEDDPHINPLGAKGIGEIGIVGVAAAIGNAVFNATGVRVRELPITLDKVLAGLPAMD